jgi:hypothetical protein
MLLALDASALPGGGAAGARATRSAAGGAAAAAGAPLPSWQRVDAGETSTLASGSLSRPPCARIGAATAEAGGKRIFLFGGVTRAAVLGATVRGSVGGGAAPRVVPPSAASDADAAPAFLNDIAYVTWNESRDIRSARWKVFAQASTSHTGEWPAPRAHAALLALGPRLAAVGTLLLHGGVGADGRAMDSIHVVNLSTMTWSVPSLRHGPLLPRVAPALFLLPPAPAAAAVAAAAAAGGGGGGEEEAGEKSASESEGDALGSILIFGGVSPRGWHVESARFTVNSRGERGELEPALDGKPIVLTIGQADAHWRVTEHRSDAYGVAARRARAAAVLPSAAGGGAALPLDATWQPMAVGSPTHAGTATALLPPLARGTRLRRFFAAA